MNVPTNLHFLVPQSIFHLICDNCHTMCVGHRASALSLLSYYIQEIYDELVQTCSLNFNNIISLLDEILQDIHHIKIGIFHSTFPKTMKYMISILQSVKGSRPYILTTSMTASPISNLGKYSRDLAKLPFSHKAPPFQKKQTSLLTVS